MQADVTLGVIVAVLAPLYGAAIAMLFCPQACIVLQARNKSTHKHSETLLPQLALRAHLNVGNYHRIVATYRCGIRQNYINLLAYTFDRGVRTCLRPSTLFHNSHHITPCSDYLRRYLDIDDYLSEKVLAMRGIARVSTR